MPQSTDPSRSAPNRQPASDDEAPAEGGPEVRRSQLRRSEQRQRWVAATTIALLVLLPVLGGRILGPGWGHPAHPDEAVEQDDARPEAGEPREQPPSAATAATVPTLAEPAAGGPWRFATTDEVWSQPVAADVGPARLVLVGSDDGTVYALDASSGDLRWRHEGSGAVRRRVQIVQSGGDDLAVWAGGDGVVRSADAADGTPRWTARAGARSGVATGAGRVVVGTDSGLLALDAGTGRTVWRADVGRVGATPELEQGVVFAGTADGAVLAVDVRSGDRLWRFEAGAAISTSPDRDGAHVLVTAGDGTLYCLGADDGRERWRSQTSEFVGSAPTTAGGRVFVGGGDGALWAFDIARGLALWRRGLPQTVRGTPTVIPDPVHGDTLWVAAGERYLASVRARDGAPLRVFAVEGWVSASPILAPGSEDRLVFATSEGNVHGLSVSDVDQFAPAGPARAATDPKLVMEPSFHDGEPEILWRDESPTRVAAAPAVAGGRVIYGAGRELRALSAPTGERLWTLAADGLFDAPPTVVGSRVLAARRAGRDGRGALHAVDLASGEELWRKSTAGDVSATPTVWGPQVVFGSHSGDVKAVDLARGDDVWSHRVAGPVVASAAVSGSRSFGILIVGDCAGGVSGLAIDSGRELWRLEVDDCIATDVLVETVGGQELAYVADAGGTLRAVDPAVGGVLWQANLGGAPGRGGAFATGTLYLGALDRKVWALRALDGTTVWQFPLDQRVAGAVAVDQGITYALSLGAGLHALSAINGQEFWRFDVAAPAYDLTVADGVVYLASASAAGEGGVLWAVRVP